jgi:hypothetical protein
MVVSRMASGIASARIGFFCFVRIADREQGLESREQR